MDAGRACQPTARSCVLLGMRLCVAISLAIASLVSLALLPASAGANGKRVAPPGNSAVSQYLEVVPTAGGGRPSTAIGSGGSVGSPGSGGSGGYGASSALTPAIQHALAQQGSAGQRVAALANSTGLAARARTARHRHHTQMTAPSNAGASGRRTTSSRTNGGTPLTTLAKALAGSSASGGLSPLLPAVLIVTALGGGLLAALRRRRTT